MKYLILGVLLSFCVQANCAEKAISQIHYAYELGRANTFDFSGDGTHECGSNLYRVVSPSEDSANRKFSMVLLALSTNRKLVVNTEGCVENRMKLGWVRVLR